MLLTIKEDLLAGHELGYKPVASVTKRTDLIGGKHHWMKLHRLFRQHQTAGYSVLASHCMYFFIKYIESVLFLNKLHPGTL